MIELHSSPTPNAQKVMIMLEETGLEWKHFDVNIRLGEQFTPDYLKLSLNNKIPAIAAMEARPAVQRNNRMAAEIRERMTQAAEGKSAINMFDTKDNAERLAKATKA